MSLVVKQSIKWECLSGQKFAVLSEEASQIGKDLPRSLDKYHTESAQDRRSFCLKLKGISLPKAPFSKSHQKPQFRIPGVIKKFFCSDFSARTAQQTAEHEEVEAPGSGSGKQAQQQRDTALPTYRCLLLPNAKGFLISTDTGNMAGAWHPAQQSRCVFCSESLLWARRSSSHFQHSGTPP